MTNSECSATSPDSVDNAGLTHGPGACPDENNNATAHITHLANVSKTPQSPDVVNLINDGEPVCFSELQYCEVIIEKLPNPALALKDMGAEVSLIKEDLIRDLDLPSVGTLSIKGVLGAPVEV